MNPDKRFGLFENNTKKNSTNFNRSILTIGFFALIFLCILVLSGYFAIRKLDLDEKILSRTPEPLVNIYLRIKNENIKQSVKERLEEELNMRQEKYNLAR